MKSLVLKIRHVNWGIIGPGDWNNTEWKIYNDKTVDIKISYNFIDDSEENKTGNCELTTEVYEKLLNKIQLSKESDVEIKACDGDAWEIIQYENGKEIWKRDLGYIYGIKPLEEISIILNSLIKK